MSDYRLGPVRDQRARDERAKRSDLAAAVHDARATEQRVEAAARRVAAIRTAIAAARTTAVEPLADRVRADRFCARLRRELEAAVAEQLRAEAAHAGHLADIDHVRAQLTHARAQRQVIERHFAAWRESQRKLADRRSD